MAKTVAPLFGIDASGALADTVVFSKWRGRNYVRIRVMPAQPRTDPQVGVRASFTGLVALIKSETASVQHEWDEAGKTKGITWLNAFVSQNQSNLKVGKGIQQHPTATPEAQPPTAPSLTCTGAKGRVIVTISVPTTSPTAPYAYLFHAAISTTAITPAWSNLKALGRMLATETGWAVSFELPLKPGTYHAQARVSSANAVLSDPSTDVSFTVT